MGKSGRPAVPEKISAQGDDQARILKAEMSTPALTVIRGTEWSGTLMDVAWISRRFDGNPGVHGRDLRRILKGKRFTTATELTACVLSGLVKLYQRFSQKVGYPCYMLSVNVLPKSLVRDVAPCYLYYLSLDHPCDCDQRREIPSARVLLRVFEPTEIGSIEPGIELYSGSLDAYKRPRDHFGDHKE